MNTITVYSNANGKIWGVYTCPENTNDYQCPPDHSWIQGEYGADTFYFYNSEATIRPTISLAQSENIQANGTDICLISGIPLGATVTSNGTTITADGNPIEFVTDIPGEHKLKITLWPYQDAEVTIDAI